MIKQRDFLKHLILAAGLAFGAVTPVAAFELTPPAMTFEQERANAMESHEQVLAQFGGIYTYGDLNAYVERVGQRVVKSSNMPNRPFRFFVLNTPMVNAFTVGGGYVYVTRGILASINSEAELAALLGHEIGHVTARHTARRETRMKQDRAAAIGIGLLTGSFTAALLADSTGSLLRQAYSRKQEAESDYLGVISMDKAGYDPHAMPKMLGSLKREVALMNQMAGDQGGTSLPAWLSDHPETDDRIEDTQTQVRRMGRKEGDGEIGRDNHLDAIDGILFGNDPANGVVMDGSFIHPEIGVMFDIPDGFVLQDLGGVLIASRDEDSVVTFTAARWPADKPLSEFALSVWYSLTDGDLGELDRLEDRTVNGLPAVEVAKRVEFGRKRSYELVSVAYQLENGIVASVSMLSKSPATKTQLDGFNSFADSVRAATQADLDAVPVPRISVVGVKSGETAQSVSAGMIQKDFKRERFEALNGVGDSLEVGQRVKLVVDGR